jgi:hypothetical protein
MTSSQTHLKDIVSSSESLQNVLVLNEEVLESFVSGFDWDLFSSPEIFESLVIPVDELILSLGDLVWDAFTSFSVGLGLNNQENCCDHETDRPHESYQQHGKYFD